MDKLTEVPLYILMTEMTKKIASNSIDNIYDKMYAIFEEEFNNLQNPISVTSTTSTDLVYNKNDNKNDNKYKPPTLIDDEGSGDSDSDDSDSDSDDKNIIIGPTKEAFLPYNNGATLVALDNDMTGGGKYNIANLKSTDLKRLITHIIRVGLLDKMHDFSNERNNSWHGPTNGVVRGKNIINDMTKIIKAFELEYDNIYNFENIYDENSNPPDEQEVKFEYLRYFSLIDKIKYYTGIQNMKITKDELANINTDLTEIIDVENIQNLVEFKTDFSLNKTTHVYDAVLPRALNHLTNASSAQAICLCNIWDSANQGAVTFENLYENTIKNTQGFSLNPEITIRQGIYDFQIYNLVHNNNEYPYDDIYMRMFDNKLFRETGVGVGVKIQLRIAVNTEKVCGVAIIITKEDYTDIYNSGYKYKRDINGDDFKTATPKSKAFFVSTGFSVLELSNCLQLLDTLKQNKYPDISNLDNSPYNATLIEILKFLMTSMGYTGSTPIYKDRIIDSLKLLLLKFKFSGDQGSVLTAKLFNALFVSGDALASVAGCAHGVSTIGSVYCGPGLNQNDLTTATDLTLKNVFLFSSVPITPDIIIAEIQKLEKEINVEIKNNNPVISDNVLGLLGTIKNLNKTMKVGITNDIKSGDPFRVDIKKIKASNLSQSSVSYDTLINYRIELITYQDNISI